ncbi:hypothetical protein IPL68_04875 [Candidatus Saccharibacteria bacterium]|nr:MAG: hypothetical protein IPL68_04875 [Candidatus Saccharibacteria bacterium]
MVAQGEQSHTPERIVVVLGPELPLLHKVELGENHQDSPVMVGEKTSIYSGPDKQKIVSEAEVITDYYDFLSRVQSTAEKDSGAKAETALGDARRFASETVFMTKTEREDATRGLAAHYVKYLAGDSTHELLLFVPIRRHDHSQGFVSREIAAQIKNLDPTLAGRVHITSLEEGDDTTEDLKKIPEKNTKIGIFDDWSVTGNHLANALAHAAQSLDREGLARFKSALEVGLLVARDDQLQGGFDAIMQDVEASHGLSGVPVVSYFKSPARQQYHGPMPTGSHASVDYGFEGRIQAMRDYLAEVTHVDERLPWMAAIVRQY